MFDFLNYRKTYAAGLLQAKAFRILKKQTNDALQSYDINATDWGILGLLMTHKDGMTLRCIAVELGVKPPYVTRAMAGLSSKGYVSIAANKDDVRFKQATITSDGKNFVTKVEPAVAKKLKETFADVGVRDLLGYVTTLHSITKKYGDEVTTTDLEHLQD